MLKPSKTTMECLFWCLILGLVLFLVSPVAGATPPPSGRDFYPVRPIALLDVNLDLLQDQFPRISLYEGVRPYVSEDNAEGQKFAAELQELDNLINKIGSQFHSLHAALWFDLEKFSKDPEDAMEKPLGLLFGRIESSPDEIVAALELGDPAGKEEGVEYWALDDSFLVFHEGWAIAGEEAALKVLKGEVAEESLRAPDDPESAYQRLRNELGDGAAVFGFFDAEVLLEGPITSYVSNAVLEKDEDDFFGALLVSAVIGINSLEGAGIALGLEGDTLVGRAAVAHGGRGIFQLLPRVDCPNRGSEYLPADLDVCLVHHPFCGESQWAEWGGFLLETLGSAAPVFEAGYEQVLARLGQDFEVGFDPVEVVLSGGLSEVNLGIRLTEGAVRFPEVVMVAPLDISKESLLEVEMKIASEQGLEFESATASGHWYRHAIIPLGLPVVVDLSYTVYDGMLMIASSQGLLQDTLAACENKAVLAETLPFQEFKDSVGEGNLLSLFVAPHLTTDLLQLAEATGVAAAIKRENADAGQLFRESLERIAEQPESTGLSLGLNGSELAFQFRVAEVRSWFLALMCLDAIDDHQDSDDDHNDKEDDDDEEHGED